MEWNDFDVLICDAVSSAGGVLFPEPRRPAAATGRAFAAAEMVMDVAEDGICGRVRREGGFADSGGTTAMVSRRDGVCWVADGGAGIPVTLLLRADIGARRWARWLALDDVGCIDCLALGAPAPAPNSVTSRTLIVDASPDSKPPELPSTLTLRLLEILPCGTAGGGMLVRPEG